MIKVLIVDDQSLVREGLSLMLSMYDNIQIVGEATNGKEAVELLNQTEVDLILMDIQMPEMNGYETTIELRKNVKFSNTPIIALTAGTTDGEKEKCLETGMNDYISKPIDKEQLKNVLNRWLNLV